MARCSFVVLGLGLVVGACSSDFTSNGAGSGGTGASAGHAGSVVVGDAGEAGSAVEPSGGSAGNGSAGASQGGTAGIAGSAGGASAGSAGLIDLPPDIPQLGLMLWLRADAGVLAQNGRVQRWLDQSGRQTDGSQSPGESQPALVEKGFNGKPALSFDGANDYLQFEEGFTSFNNGLSIFIVAQPEPPPPDVGCWSMFEVSTGSEKNDVSFGSWQDKWLYEVLENTVHDGAVTYSRPVLYSVLHRQARTADLRANGALLASGTFDPPDTTKRTENYLGRSLYDNCSTFHGLIAEVIVYQRGLTLKEQQSVELYLNQHWALTPLPTP